MIDISYRTCFTIDLKSIIINLYYEFCWDKFWKTNEIVQLLSGIEIIRDKKCRVTFGFEYIKNVTEKKTKVKNKN